MLKLARNRSENFLMVCASLNQIAELLVPKFHFLSAFSLGRCFGSWMHYFAIVWTYHCTDFELLAMSCSLHSKLTKMQWLNAYFCLFYIFPQFQIVKFISSPWHCRFMRLREGVAVMYVASLLEWVLSFFRTLGGSSMPGISC